MWWLLSETLDSNFDSTMRMTSGFELGGAFRILASSCPCLISDLGCWLATDSNSLVGYGENIWSFSSCPSYFSSYSSSWQVVQTFGESAPFQGGKRSTLREIQATITARGEKRISSLHGGDSHASMLGKGYSQLLDIALQLMSTFLYEV